MKFFITFVIILCLSGCYYNQVSYYSYSVDRKNNEVVYHNEQNPIPPINNECKPFLLPAPEILPTRPSSEEIHSIGDDEALDKLIIDYIRLLREHIGNDRERINIAYQRWLQECKNNTR